MTLIKKNETTYPMDDEELAKVLELHYRTMRVNRNRSRALIWLVSISGWLAIIYFAWVLFFPVSVEDRFYSAACKYDVAEMPASVRSTCAARETQKWRFHLPGGFSIPL